MRPSELRAECVISYVTNTADWVCQLRGLPYFTWLRNEYARVGAPTVVTTEPGVVFARRAPTVAFIIMPVSDEAETLIDQMALRGCPTIVDVTADVLGLLDYDEDPEPIMTIAALESRQLHDTRDLSFDERATLARCLRLAKAVTTSWPQLVQPLREMLGHDDVFHLADTHGPQDIARFDEELAGPFSVLVDYLK